MKIAFYAPLKSPNHETPSGDRTIGRLILKTLVKAGHQVEVISEIRSFSSKPTDFLHTIKKCDLEVKKIISKLNNNRPDIMLIYHLYYKAPDFIGLKIAKKFNIPYIAIEASYAPIREKDSWKFGSLYTKQAINSADLIINLNKIDSEAIEPLIKKGAKSTYLPPFVDEKNYISLQRKRSEFKDKLSCKLNINTKVPWLITAAMMRRDDSKLPSFLAIEKILSNVKSDYFYLIAGDGEVKNEIEKSMKQVTKNRVRFLGELEKDDLIKLYVSGDLYIWPGINEAFGMSFLEAQASGLPVITFNYGGISEVIVNKKTGLLIDKNNHDSFSRAIDIFIKDNNLRKRYSNSAKNYIKNKRSISNVGNNFNKILVDIKNNF